MKATVTVRLRYTVTGSVSAAKLVIGDTFLRFLPGLQEFAGPDYSARKWSADVDPDEVSGYKNYETFHVALFLSNTRSRYEECRLLAMMALKKGVESNDPDSYSEGLVWLADELENLVEQHILQVDEREGSCKTDNDALAHFLMTAALEKVNWVDIAEEWLNQAKEEAGSW